LPPSLTSARTFDTQTLELTFSEAISVVNGGKISATGWTLDATYNLDGFTAGVKISPSDTKKVYLRGTTPLATDYTTTTLALAACAVRDVTGNTDLNEAGNCPDLGPATNANTAVTGQTIADGVGPTLTLTTPATAGTDNATVAVDYTLSEAAATNSVLLSFTATGGAADAASPHTLLLDNALVGGTATAAGQHAFSFDASDFTSLEAGAGDALVDGALYTVALAAKDVVNNAGTPVSSTDWIYDTTAPIAPITTQNFSSPTATAAPDLAWGTVADAVTYRVELSLQATNYTPSFLSQDIAAPTTNWVVSPAFATDSTMDDTYVWRVYATDAAGNTSVASNQQTFVLNTQTDTPTVILSDQTNSSQTSTDSQTVNVALDAYSIDAVAYLLSETQSTQPLAAAITTALPGAAPQTVPYTFATATEEAKTVYVWVKDTLGNVSSNVSSASITLDTTPPPQPTLTVADANGGALAGKTNAASISVITDNDTGVAAWCLASGGSGYLPTAPTESACTTGQTGGSAASTWLTVKPTAYTLPATGVHDVYLWTRDAAGNISAASAAASIDYQTTPPPDPAVQVSDTTSGSTTWTNAATVNVSTTNDATAVAWIVSQTQASLPVEASADWGAKPATLALTDGDGAKSVYIWVKDAYGNLNTNQVSTGITLDTTRPALSMVGTLDLSGNGQLDALQVTLSEPIDDTGLALGDFAVAGYAMNNLTGTLGTLTFTGGISTGVTPNDEIFYLAITESGALDTGATPTLTYTAGTLADRAGNTTLSFGPTTPSDGIAPRQIALEAYDTGGAAANGKLDQIKVVFSESLTATANSGPWLLGSVPSGGSLASVGTGTTNTANDTVILTITEGSGAPDTTVGALTVSLNNSASVVKDTAGNVAASFGSEPVTDKMAPVLVAANYISTGTVANDSLILAFSESLADAASFLGTPATELTLAGGGAVTNANYNTVTADDASYTIELNAGDTALTIGTSTTALRSAVVADAAGNASTGTVAVTVGGGLILNEIAWAGSATSTADEYLELRNLADTALDFGVNTHCVYIGSTKLADLTGTLAGSGRYLIARYSAADVNSALASAPDLVPATWVTLPDTALQVSLYSSADAVCDQTDTLLDQADDGVGAPFAGTAGVTPASMERNASVGLGTSAASWHTAVASTGFDNTNQLGTPGLANIADNTAPSFTAGSQFPAHQALLPTDAGYLAIAYTENTGGVGVDTASVTMEIDLNGDGDWLDAGEGTAGICSGAALTTTTTSVSCIPTSALSSGKHSVRVRVSDLAANTSQTTWDFWIDSFTVTIANVDQADLGILLPGVGGTTTDNTQHTKVTITTYGAGITLSGTAASPLTSGSSQIPWHANNTPTAGVGSAFRVKEGASGTFGNYYNWQATSQIAAKPTLTGAQIASNNALQTYTFYVQHYASIAAGQTAGQYSQDIQYGVTTTY
jgi:hypothetical protein